jgi:multimeric flavodoxin WrbA
MSANVLMLSGSAHKDGTTGRVCDRVARSLSQRQVAVEFVHLDDLDYVAGGCTGCMGCQKRSEYRCVLSDEATPLLARIPQFDALVLATPVYWYGPSAQLKRFTDRMFSLVKMHASGPTHCLGDLHWGLIATAGGGLDDGLRLTRDVVAKMAATNRAQLRSLLIDHAGQMDEQDVADRAETFAATLLE